MHHKNFLTSLYGWGCANRIVYAAINATVTEKACVCQLLNMGHGHTGEQLPYKSLTFEMLRWARLPLEGRLEERFWAVVADNGDVPPPPPPPLCLAGRQSGRERRPSGLPTCLSLLRPCFAGRSGQNGAAQHRPGGHKEFHHKLLLSVLRWLTWFLSYLSSARLLLHHRGDARCCRLLWGS